MPRRGKIALLRAAWGTFNEAAARVSPQLRKGPRGGHERDQIVRHVNGAEIGIFAPKVGVKVPPETVGDVEARRAYPDAFVEGIREHHTRGESARSWGVAVPDRRCAWHMLDHAWELEDRDLTNASASGHTPNTLRTTRAPLPTPLSILLARTLRLGATTDQQPVPSVRMRRVIAGRHRRSLRLANRTDGSGRSSNRTAALATERSSIAGGMAAHADRCRRAKRRVDGRSCPSLDRSGQKREAPMSPRQELDRINSCRHGLVASRVLGATSPWYATRDLVLLGSGDADRFTVIDTC